MTNANKIPAPFSAPSYTKNSDRCESGEGCALCGRDTVARAGRMEVRVVDGGARFAAMSETEVNSDMGWFYIGPECAKKVPATHKRVAE